MKNIIGKYRQYAAQIDTQEKIQSVKDKFEMISYKMLGIFALGFSLSATSSLAGAPATDPDGWVIVKRKSEPECYVIAARPGEDDVEIVATFKDFILDEGLRKRIVRHCGCSNEGCSWELPQ